MRRLLSSFAFFILSINLLGFDLRAEEKLPRIRDPKTPEGLYRSSIMDDGVGKKVAENTSQSYENYFSQDLDLDRKVVLINADTGKILRTEKEISTALEKGLVAMVWDQAFFVIKGDPLFDIPFLNHERSDRLALTQNLLEKYHPNADIVLKSFGKPKGVGKSVQQVIYMFPLAQDVQTPTPFEKRTTMWKLLVSNGSQQVIVQMTNPWPVALTKGGVNFANSYVTGRYGQTFANWFNRSSNGSSRFIRSAILGQFFTFDLGVPANIVKGNGEAFKHLSGWWQFWLDTLPSFGLNLYWRFYGEQSVNKYQKAEEAAGRGAEARATATNLKFLMSVITTPAFLYTLTHRHGYDVAGYQIPFNEGHLVMIGVGIYGMLHYYGAMDWAPWTKRLESLNWYTTREFERSRIPDLYRWMKTKIKESRFVQRYIEKQKEMPKASPEEVLAFLEENGHRMEPELRAVLDASPKLKVEVSRSLAVRQFVAGPEKDGPQEKCSSLISRIASKFRKN